MDYKKIFKTDKSRKAMLNALSFLPDPIMLTLQYRIKLGRNPDLKNPVRFTEKLQWYKMNYRDPIMHNCVDKYLVREYIKEKGLEDKLIPLIGYYNSLDEIDWDSLPDSFVIKTSHGGGGLNVIVCDDKSKLSQDEINAKLSFDNHPVKKNSLGREWAYYGLKPGIVIEEMLVNRENPEAGVTDYKFFCYRGHAKYVVVDMDRYIGHKRNFYDREWNDLKVISDCPPLDREAPKPPEFEEMLRVADELSKDFPYVRVDLYNVDGKVYFGELTFYPWSGYVQYEPDEWDFKFGEDFELTEFK